MPKAIVRPTAGRRPTRNLAPKSEIATPLITEPTAVENAKIDAAAPLEDLVAPVASLEAEEPPPPVEPPPTEELCPDPKYKAYNSDDTNHHQRTNQLWKWWGELPEKFKNKISAYVYRTYPPLIDPHEGSGEFKYIDVVAAPFKEDRDLNDRYGAGDFRVYVNIAEKKKRTLATGYIKGNRDFKSMPPADRRITEVDEKGRPKWIDVHDPQCKAYVEFLRTRGLMPEAWEAKREAEMEQQTDALKTVLGMLDKATSKKEESATPLHETVGKVIEVSMAGAQAGQQILKDTIGTLQDQLSKGNNNQQMTETLNTLLTIADKISKQNDPKPYMETILKLNESIATLQMERLNESTRLQMERLNDKIEQLKTAQNPASAATQNLSTLIEEFRKIQDLVGGGEEPRGGRMPGWLAAVSALAEPAARIVGNITQAFMFSRMPPGAGMGGPPPGYAPPPAPEPAPAGPMSNVDPSVYAPAPQMVAQPFRDPRLYPHLAQEQPPQPEPGAQARAHPGPQAPPAADPHMMLLVSIAPAFLNQFRDGLGGDDLADWLVGGYGERVFTDLIARAKASGLPAHQALLMLIDSYPPLAQELSRENRDDVERFVKEFAEFDGEQYDRKRGRDAVSANAN